MGFAPTHGPACRQAGVLSQKYVGFLGGAGGSCTRAWMFCRHLRYYFATAPKSLTTSGSRTSKPNCSKFGKIVLGQTGVLNRASPLRH